MGKQMGGVRLVRLVNLCLLGAGPHRAPWLLGEGGGQGAVAGAAARRPGPGQSGSGSVMYKDETGGTDARCAAGQQCWLFYASLQHEILLPCECMRVCDCIHASQVCLFACMHGCKHDCYCKIAMACKDHTSVLACIHACMNGQGYGCYTAKAGKVDIKIYESTWMS
jgi:hypothetical protein